jgi:glutamate dehydrogenase/leucine dehydrogenase
LAGRGILYIPDFVANAGGVIQGVSEFTKEPSDSVRRRVDGIYETVLEVLWLAKQRAITPQRAAVELARRRLGTR